MNQRINEKQQHHHRKRTNKPNHTAPATTTNASNAAPATWTRRGAHASATTNAVMKALAARATALTPSETAYAFLSVCLLVFVYVIIVVVDTSGSPSPSVGTRHITSSSSSSSRSSIRPSSINVLSASGSAKQMQLLIDRIAVHADNDTARCRPVPLSDVGAAGASGGTGASAKPLVVAVAVNYAYRHLALNFVCNLQRLRICNYVVLAMDRPVYDFLSRHAIHVFFHDLMSAAKGGTATERISSGVFSSPHLSDRAHHQHGHYEQPHYHHNPHHYHHASHPHPHSRHHHVPHQHHRGRRLLSVSSSTTHQEEHNPHDHRQQAAGSDQAVDFGTSDFVETARRKSKLVLRLLSLGHSVLFSDVDVVWISNPLPLLHSLLLQHSNNPPADFVMQSDRSDDVKQPLNHNLNSGFYLARSNARTITALRAVIKYSYAIRRSEQKAFNYVLCGAFKTHVGGPGKRVGDDRCVYRDTNVVVLPTESHPNGSNGSLWERMWNETEPFDDSSSSDDGAHSGRNRFRSSRGSDMWMFGHHYHHRPRRRDQAEHGNFSASFPQVTVVHANYVVGRQAKIDRIRQLGYWCFPSSFSAY